MAPPRWFAKCRPNFPVSVANRPITTIDASPLPASRLACSQCGSGLLWREDLPFVYLGGVREAAADLSWTSELFGWKGKQSDLVISRDAFRGFKRTGVKGVDYRPITIADRQN